MDELLDGVDWERFGRTFLQRYAAGGFGRMPKRDVDILVVYLLMEMGTLDTFGDWQLAQWLQISPQRIQNLRTDARYVHWDADKRQQWVRTRFFELIANEAFVVKAGRITLQVPDPFVRAALRAELEAAYQVVDTSFNGRLLEMGSQGFAALLTRLLSEQERKALETDPATRKALGDRTLEDRLQEAVVETREGVGDTLKGEVVSAIAKAVLGGTAALLAALPALL